MARRKWKNLWKVVRRLVLENYDLLKKKRIREGWYMLGDMLATLIGKEVTREEYVYFTANKQGYSTYRDDLWTSLEQKLKLERPEAKPYGVFFDRGKEHPISELAEVWKQARGFIFTEKIDDGADLKVLSKFGWVVIAGGGLAGFPTRQIRRLLKDDSRPVLAFHDADKSGEGIYKALGFETRRTKHLDIALGDRVTDLGLNEQDAKALKLRSRPEPPKYKGEPRWETSALAVLTTRMGIDNPKLAYVVAKVVVKGIKISPTTIPKEKALKAELRWQLRESIERIIENTAAKHSKVEGETVDAELPDAEKIEVPELAKGLDKLASKLVPKVRWITEADYGAEAKKLTDPRLTKLLKGGKR